MGQPKTALVLSAGGMFGAYQAGAYKALLRYFTPDLVVGASVGALNGWPIAARCAPDELIGRWLHPSAGSALQLYPDAGWKNGWFDPAPLRRQAEELVAEFEPAIPFGLVVVQLPRMRTVLVEHPNVTAAHLQATCSIPLFLPSVRLDGIRSIDGGFLDKLPIGAAIRMGATRIIAIDSLPDVGIWWLRAGIRVMRLFTLPRRIPRQVEITIVSPSEPLGNAQDAVFWKFENVARWIRLGERDAARTFEQQSFPVPVASNE